ncbi:MAG TPA: hypothetical protein VFB72_16145 [Verrucomicrobiae bacterium]|nr:hypothetical protein [Verrucomicrobiae bacterium]
MNGTTPNLDSMLTLEQCAGWLQMKPRDLQEKSREPRPKIPAFRPGPKVVRFHPRTILAKMARDAGIPMDLIAASYGIRQEAKP